LLIRVLNTFGPNTLWICRLMSLPSAVRRSCIVMTTPTICSSGSPGADLVDGFEQVVGALERESTTTDRNQEVARGDEALTVRQAQRRAGSR
jgi:hypothetical protein